MNITPIKNNIIFSFVDAVNSKGEFEKPSTESGIVLKSSFDDSAKSPRWVNVLAVGPECKDVKVGMQALLPNLRWTAHTKVEGQMVWKTDESEVVAVRPNDTTECTPLRDVVIFKQQRNQNSVSQSGIMLIIHHNDDTPSGAVISVGPQADANLKGSTIYYSDVNFTDTFVFKGAELSFIKCDNVLAYSAD